MDPSSSKPPSIPSTPPPKPPFIPSYSSRAGPSSSNANMNTNNLRLAPARQSISESSPLLGTSNPKRNIPNWNELSKQLEREGKLDAIGALGGSGTPGGDERNSVFTYDSLRGSGNGLGTAPDSGADSTFSDRITRGTGNGKGRVNGDGESWNGDMESGVQTPLNGQPGQKKRKSIPALVRQRSKYYVPVTSWLPAYEWSTFPSDVIAGVSVACLIIPQAMSYASGLAHLTPVAGIYSVIVPALVYSILGTCRQLSVGPEAALSLLVGQLISDALTEDPHTIPDHPERIAMAIGLIVTMQVGLVTFFLGFCRLGFLDVVLSRALLRGFITAIGIIIFIEQAIPMLGLNTYLHDTTISTFSKFLFIIQHVKYTNAYTAGLSLICLVWLIGAKILKQTMGKKLRGLKFVPEIFLLVVVATFVTGHLRLDTKGVAVLGKLQSSSGSPFGVPFHPKYLKYAHQTFPTAAVIAVIGYVDSIMAAKENSLKFGYPISANRELVALGASNFFASFCTGTGCVPAFGSITRSRLNANIGGRSQMSSIVTASCAIMTLFLLPYFHFLPRAVLAAIVAVVVYSILAEVPHEIAFYWKARAKTEALQAIMTFVLTLIFSVEVGLVASVAFSLIVVVQKSTTPRIKIIGRLKDSDDWIPVDENPDAVEDDYPGVLVVRIRENLNFANTGAMKERLRRLELYGADRSHPSEEPKREAARAIVFHMNDVEDIDSSALQIVYELVKSYTERGVDLYFVHLRSRQMEAFHRIGLLDILDDSHFQRDLRSAMRQIEDSGPQL